VNSVVLGTVALVLVVLTFAFAMLALVVSHGPSRPRASERAASDDYRSADETLSGVLRDIERLAALRDRGALTDREFSAQKARIMADSAPAEPRNAVRRTR
jgi:hypothetical protein